MLFISVAYGFSCSLRFAEGQVTVDMKVRFVTDVWQCFVTSMVCQCIPSRLGLPYKGTYDHTTDRCVYEVDDSIISMQNSRQYFFKLACRFRWFYLIIFCNDRITFSEPSSTNFEQIWTFSTKIALLKVGRFSTMLKSLQKRKTEGRKRRICRFRLSHVPKLRKRHTFDIDNPPTLKNVTLEATVCMTSSSWLILCYDAMQTPH